MERIRENMCFDVVFLYEKQQHAFLLIVSIANLHYI